MKRVLKITSNSKQDDKNSVIQYLDVIKKEYEFERNKKVSLETRAGILLTVLGGISLLLFDKVNINSIISLFTKNITFIDLVNILSGFGVYVLLIFSICCLSRILSVDEYKNFDVKQIDEELLNEDSCVGSSKIIFVYREIIIDHRLINNKKAKRLKLAITFILISLLLLLTYLNTHHNERRGTVVDIGPKDVAVNIHKISSSSNNKNTNNSQKLKTETILESDHSLTGIETFSKKDTKKDND